MSEYVDLATVGSVLAHRALAAVKGIDGRQVDPVVLARLEEIATIADSLCLPDSDRFAQLVAVATKGHTKDLGRAALTIL